MSGARLVLEIEKTHKNARMQRQISLSTSQQKTNTVYHEELYKTTHALTTQQTSLHLCRPHDLFLLHRLSHMNVIAAITEKKKTSHDLLFAHAENKSCSHNIILTLLQDLV